MNEDKTIDEIEELKSFGSPFRLIKKALSSFFVMLMIATGLLVNWGFAILFLIFCFSSTSWTWLLIGFLLLTIVFPAIYLFLAYSYGQSMLLWEVYKEALRPIAAKVFSGTLDKFLMENPKDKSPLDESKIVKEVEARQKHFLERLPDFIRAYFQLFFTSKDIIKIVKEQRKSGAEKEAVKKKAMQSFFEALDLQMSELMEPSLYLFYIVGGVNIISLYFLF